MANRKKSSIIKWIVIGVAIVALGVGGFFGYKAYENYLANKIYAPNDNVGFPDFDVKVTKAEFKAVDLPIDKDTVKKYGAIDKNGREYTPSEWYSVPLIAIEQAVNMLQNGDIADYHYNKDLQ